MQTRLIFGDRPFSVHLRRDRGPLDPILLITELGDPVDRFSFAFHQIIEATEEELLELRRAGYAVG